MRRNLFISAVLTGFFCAIFALAIETLTDMLDRTNILTLSFASGFLGSLFASFVLRGRKR